LILNIKYKHKNILDQIGSGSNVYLNLKLEVLGQIAKLPRKIVFEKTQSS
jgi:hypothetical protein